MQFKWNEIRFRYMISFYPELFYILCNDIKYEFHAEAEERLLS